MADLTAGQIPKYANVISSQGVAAITASTNTVTLGVDTNGLTVYTAGTLGSQVFSLLSSTTDTVTVNVFIWALNGAVVRPIGLVNVPLSAGNVSGVSAVDLVAGIAGLPIDNTGKRYIQLYANETLRVGALANLTTAKVCYVTAMGRDFQA